MSNALIGKYLHTFNEHDDGCSTVEYQGLIVEQVDDSHYIVDIFDWINGGTSCQMVLSMTALKAANLYSSAEWMRDTAEMLLSAVDRHQSHVSAVADA